MPPPRTGRRGRPAKKGERLPRLAELATTATWRTVTVTRYGRVDTVVVAVIDCLWYGPFGDTPGRAVLVREPDTPTGYDLALFTTDPDSDTERIVARYADRWSIEPANARLTRSAAARASTAPRSCATPTPRPPPRWPGPAATTPSPTTCGSRRFGWHPAAAPPTGRARNGSWCATTRMPPAATPQCVNAS